MENQDEVEMHWKKDWWISLGNMYLFGYKLRKETFFPSISDSLQSKEILGLLVTPAKVTGLRLLSTQWSAGSQIPVYVIMHWIFQMYIP